MTETEKRVPELRFKGFIDAWEQRKLGELIENQTILLQSDGNHGELYPKSTEFSETGIPYLSASNIDLNTSTIDFSSSKYLPINKAKIFKKGIAKNGDILLAHNATVGPTVMLSTDYPFVVLSTTLTLFRINQSKMNPNFFLYTLRSVQFQNALKKMMKQTTRNQVPILTQRNIDVSYPNNIDEQAKLGIFFKQLDETIALHQRKLALLKQLKQTYLANMFPIQGENVPKLRFASFSTPWEQRKFFDNIQNTIDFRGRTPKKLGMDWSELGYLALSALNVKNGYIDPSADAHYGNEELYKKWMGGRELKKGQVLFTTEAPMGNVAQVPDNQGYILSQRTITFDVNDEKMTDNFLAVLLRSPNVSNDLSALSSGGTAKGVSQKSLSGLRVTVPKNLCEQERLGLFFKQLDSTIDLHQQKIAHLKSVKSILLNKMFI